ncbi:MAG: hypothetical protein HZB65_01625 [Candidatus Aenigmarchaeota archaeon]|nr:hypothetical protein [Candidatus Aenigmarchaeota archaeon]
MKKNRTKNPKISAELTDGKAVESDLTDMQDLSIAVMNLINLEEHLAFTAMKTKKKEYLVVQVAVRKKRVKLMKKLLKNTEGELWCISKHLLAATMRLMESSTKYIDKDPEQAYSLVKDAFDTYSLFWFLQSVENK